MKEKTEEKKVKNPIIERANTRIFKNIVIAILIMAYFVGVYVAYKYIPNEIFSRVLQGVTMLLLLISIVIFEVAYKKDSGLLAMTGIETLVLACHALALPYVLTVFKWDLMWYVTISGYLFAIYFVFKSIVIYTSGKKKYLQSFSDIAEIVKEDEPRRKEAVKRNVEDDE